MNKYVVLGSCVTSIPFYYELDAVDEKDAMRETLEFMQLKAGVEQNRIKIVKIIEVDEETQITSGNN